MAFPTHIVTAAGIVRDAKGLILLVKTYHHGWVYPGGQVEAGENLIDALKREVHEESGIEVEVGRLIGVYSNTDSYLWRDGVTPVPTKVQFDFECRATGGALCVSDETSECRWVSPEEAQEMISAPAIQARFQAYLEYDGSVRYLEYGTKPDFRLRLDRTI